MHAHRALERAEAIGDGPIIAEALALCVMYDYLCRRGIDWNKVERSLELEHPDRLVPLQTRPSTVAVFLLLFAGRHAAARERMTAVWTTAAERGDESDLGFVVLWLSWLETRSGNLDRALTLAEEAASLATLTGSRSMHAWAIAQRAFVHANRGAIAEMRRDCGEAAALGQQVRNLLIGIWIAASQALLELSLGDPAAAWQACESLAESIEANGVAEPVPFFFLPDALQALITLGQLDRAQTLLDSFERRGRELDRVWALATEGAAAGSSSPRVATSRVRPWHSTRRSWSASG